LKEEETKVVGFPSKSVGVNFVVRSFACCVWPYYEIINLSSVPFDSELNSLLLR
jgi:hypothetical protein